MMTIFNTTRPAILSSAVALAAALCLVSPAAHAAAPAIVPLQGTLTDADGTAIEGDTQITFTIYPVANGAEALWTETQTVSVADGFFVAYLGDVTQLPLTLFRDEGTLWLGITVGQDPEMDRVQLGTTPYSGYAEWCGNIPDHDHALGDMSGSLPVTALPGNVPTGAQACTSTDKVVGIDDAGQLLCNADVDTDTTYTGADFALSGQTCAGGNVAVGIDASGALICVPDIDTNTTYSGADFATSSQACSPGDVVTGIDQNGQLTCAPDANTTYSGADFALSEQACPAGTFMQGVGADGTPVCEPPPKHAGAIYRWNQFDTYLNTIGSWAMDNRADLFGGINPSNWTDGNYRAVHMSADKEVLRTLLTRKGYGGANAMVMSQVYWQYSSTSGKVTVVAFRIRNTTSSAITWPLYFYYTCYAGWSEMAGVAINGSEVWNSGGSNCGSHNTASASISVPANRTSTVIVSSPSSAAWSNHDGMHVRANLLAFYDDSLALPDGLEYVDDLDAATGGWEQ